MSNKSHRQIVLLFLCCLIFSTVILGKDWRPVSQEELSMTKGKVEADADAEAIFWEVEVDDAGQDLVMNHYIRVKILTERGREKFSKIDIQYVRGTRVNKIEARVIKPDGTIVELNKDEIYKREILKTNDVKVRAKSFAVPNIEPGVVLEYRYQERHKRRSADNFRMDFQRDIPMQRVKYVFKPYNDARPIQFNVNTSFVKLKRGKYMIELKNMPAMHEEPFMPPEDEVRSWLMIYYNSGKQIKRTLANSQDFWSRVGGVMVRVYDIKDTLKPGKKMKAAAAEITAGATTQEEKLRKIFDYTRRKIKNLSFDTSITEDELEKIKINSNDDKTMKLRQGRQFEINKLFASLADAAGFETRIAFTGDRSKLFFNLRKTHESFIHLAGIAVKVNGNWRFFDPGNPFLPFGTLAWNEQDTTAFLLGYKTYITTKVRMSDVDDAKLVRNAKFKLDEEGTLTGEVTEKYMGHLNYRAKMNNYDSSAPDREEALKERIKNRFGEAEISNIRVENIEEYTLPFTYKYRVTIPNYAQKVGKRIFFQPSYFTANTKPTFASADRKYDIFFRYPWSEEDDIEIEMPEGYELDNASSPQPFGDNGGITRLRVNIGMVAGSKTLKLKRRFYFGKGGTVYFNKGTYKNLKGLFDGFNKIDTRPLTLKKAATSAE